MIDIATQLGAIDRQVTRQQGAEGEEVSVRIRRSYRADAADLWDALTNPERIRRWFMPLSGDLRPGGSFQLEGNAGGDILECEAPRRLRVTFGGPTSFVELRLDPEGGDRTTLELLHTVPIEMAQSGAGALYVGPGWDGGFVALELHLAGQAIDDPVTAASSPEAIELSRQSIDAWIEVVAASGTATDDEIELGRQMALAQFAPIDG